MKIRNGFVSNSSSSSFIIGNKNNQYTVDSVYETLKKAYVEMYWKGNKKELTQVKRNFRECLYVIEVDKATDKQKTADWIQSFTYWGFKKNEIKEGIWIISNGDNAIPYEFIEKIQELFDCKYMHLG